MQQFVSAGDIVPAETTFLKQYRRVALCVLVTSGLFVLAPPSAAELDPPEPGYVLIENNLALVDGKCEGNVSVRYTFLPVDTSWGLRYTANDTCVIQPEEFEYADGGIVTYRVGGGAVTSGTTWGPLNDLGWAYGIEVNWPVAACPEANWRRSQSYPAYRIENSYVGCLKWYWVKVWDHDSLWRFTSTVTAYADGELGCVTSAPGSAWPSAGCLFAARVVEDVPSWLIDAVGDPLTAVPPGSVRLEQIHT